jgi:2-polyprenyl-3-methyl-5-hydroxy-6-metoxy-1,4-benzoquinol methylase
MSSNPSIHLVDQIMDKYGVGKNYAFAYSNYWLRSRNKYYESLSEIISEPMPYPMWFNYALETNERGKALVDKLKPELPISARRALDVGCGFGGVMVAFASLGLEAVGVEIDPVRVDLAKANCQDCEGFSHVFQGDVLDNAMIATLGKFDIITCTDVMEHVLDPHQALYNMVGLLNPGGILYLEIPNKDSIKFVASDGHFSLFGITLLPRKEAIEYHSHFYDFDYDVGFYFPRHTYINNLKKLGCETHLGSPPFQPPHLDSEIPELLEKLSASYQSFLRESAKKLVVRLRLLLSIRYWYYKMRFHVKWQYHKNRSNLDLREEYLMDFWEIVARKIS